MYGIPLLRHMASGICPIFPFHNKEKSIAFSSWYKLNIFIAKKNKQHPEEKVEVTWNPPFWENNY